jgi:hypothetical protein
MKIRKGKAITEFHCEQCNGLINEGEIFFYKVVFNKKIFTKPLGSNELTTIEVCKTCAIKSKLLKQKDNKAPKQINLFGTIRRKHFATLDEVNGL